MTLPGRVSFVPFPSLSSKYHARASSRYIHVLETESSNQIVVRDGVYISHVDRVADVEDDMPIVV